MEPPDKVDNNSVVSSLTSPIDIANLISSINQSNQLSTLSIDGGQSAIARDQEISLVYSLMKAIERNRAHLTNLKACNMINVAPHHLASLFEVIPLCHGLKSLDIRAMKLQGVKGGKILAQILRGASGLTYLNIDNNQLKRDGIFKFAEALEGNQVLKELYMSCTGMGSEGAKEIAKTLQTNTTLSHLGVGHNNIKVEGLLSFAEYLKDNTTLIGLDVSLNTLDGTVIRALTDNLLLRNNASLTYLSFAENKQLGKEGGVELGHLIRSSVSLKSLNLHSCGINGTVGCEIARGLIVNTNLTDLDLSCNGLGIKGGKSILDSLKANKTLRLVSLYSNNFSDKLEEQFKQITSPQIILTSIEESSQNILQASQILNSPQLLYKFLPPVVKVSLEKKENLKEEDRTIKATTTIIQKIVDETRTEIEIVPTVTKTIGNLSDAIRMDEKIAAQGLRELLESIPLFQGQPKRQRHS